MMQLTLSNVGQERNIQRRIARELRSILSKSFRQDNMEEFRVFLENRLKQKHKWGNVITNILTALHKKITLNPVDVFKFKCYLKMMGKMHKRLRRPMKLKYIRNEINEDIKSVVNRMIDNGELNGAFKSSNSSVDGGEYYTVELRVEKIMDK